MSPRRTLVPLTVLLFTALTAAPTGRAQPADDPVPARREAAPEERTPPPEARPEPRREVAPPARPAENVRPVIAPPPPEPKPETGFGFGSYGRVGAGTDGKGATGKHFNFTTHGPRIGEEGPYVELDLYYRLRPYKDVDLKTVITLAFTEDLFHFNGSWESALALRNFFLEGNDLFTKGLSIWVGSRMYRGDDIYLLDFWPLDNLNTIGFGAAYRIQRTSLAWHLGVNRLKDNYQYQEVAVPGLFNTSENVVLLDRQRLITSLKATQELGGVDGRLGAKIKAYVEYHHLPSGTLDAHLAPAEREHLRPDQGFLVGLQAGLWNFGPNTHANLFVRYARGLAAYGEFGIPFGLAADKRAWNAQELLVALSANYELKRWFGVQVGGYVRYFKDADPNTYDWDDGWEYVVAVRPHAFLHRLFALAVELSYQGRDPAGLNPYTNTVETPGVLKVSVMPTLTFGQGTYARPQIRAIYSLVHQNQGARNAYNPQDPRRSLTIGHYLGLQAEWWFNSTYR
jgi:maltoporin